MNKSDVTGINFTNYMVPLSLAEEHMFYSAISPAFHNSVFCMLGHSGVDLLRANRLCKL